MAERLLTRAELDAVPQEFLDAWDAEDPRRLSDEQFVLERLRLAAGLGLLEPAEGTES